MLDLLYNLPGKLADLLVRLREEKYRQDRETARYFIELADTLEAMVEKLSARQIPRVEGHKFEMLIHSFEEKTKAFRKQASSTNLSTELIEIAKKASNLDAALLIYLPDVEQERAKWLAEMERMIGDCRGIAALLDKGT